MAKTTRRMPSFESVAAGNTATLRLPIGLTYHQILLTYSGVTLAQMNEIRLVGNGEVLQRFVTGTRLDKFNTFEGRAAAAGVIVLDMDRYNMRTRAGEELTALGTGRANAAENPDPSPLTTLALEIDIDAAAAAPVLSAKAIQSAPQNLGLIKKIRHFVYTAPAAGDYEISDLPKGDLINKVYFDSANINSVKLERDNFVVFERTAAENNVVQTDGVRVPQANLFVYDPSELGNSEQALATKDVNDLRFTLNMAAGVTIPVVVEYLGVPEI